MSNLIRDNYSKLNEAIDKISALGYKVTKDNNNQISFIFKNKRVIFYPKKEWSTGGSIKDCRGLGSLLNQIKPVNGQLPLVSVNQIKDKLKECIEDISYKSQMCEDEQMSLAFEASLDAFQFILDFIEGKQ